MMLDPMFLVFLVVSGIVLVFVTFKVLQHRDEGTVSKREGDDSHHPEGLSLSADSPQWNHEESHKPEKSQDQ